MTRQGVLNFEMEASALLVLAQLAGCRAGVVCTAFAQRAEGVFLEAAARPAAELACIETGMASLRILADMDSQVRAAGALYWRPSLWAVMAP
jgi:uridine phosphorylase